MKLSIVGLTFALILGVSLSWFFVGHWIKEAKKKTNNVLLITCALLLSLVSLTFGLIVIWPPIDVLSASITIFMYLVLVALGIFIMSTLSW